MTETVDYYFDIVSPASYLGWNRIPDFEARTDVKFNKIPIFLGGVMQTTGNRPPAAVPAKGKYIMMDFMRYAKIMGLPMKMNPAFPMNTLPVMRALAAWRGDEKFDVLTSAASKAAWAELIDIGDKDALSGVVANAGLNVDEFWTAATAETSKQALKDFTEEAIERGTFGAPTFYWKDHMFFGQDRFDLLESIIKAES